MPGKRDPDFKLSFVDGDYDPDGAGPLEWHGLWLRDQNDVALSYDDECLKQYKIEIFRAAGVSHRESNLQDDTFAPGEELTLIPEPNNPHDKNAVGIWDSTQRLQIGYVPKEVAGKISRLIRAGKDIRCLSLAEMLKNGRRVGLKVIAGPRIFFQEENQSQSPQLQGETQKQTTSKLIKCSACRRDFPITMPRCPFCKMKLL